MVTLTPYSTVAPLFSAGDLASWIPDDLDKQRIASYTVYEKIYWLVTDTFKLTFRGQEDRPVYLPTPRTIVDTMNRYAGKDFHYVVTPQAGSSVTADITIAQQALRDLFARERFLSKYVGNKKYGMIRGDWLWHFLADPLKPAGRRISILPVDPASYFPISDENDPDKVIGCHLIDTIQSGNDTYIKRLTYRKAENGRITSEEGLFETDKWGGPNDKPKKITKPLMELPPNITSLPVYHVRNQEEPQNPFGSSEIRGFEMLMSSLNQTITDEDLALALDGIGLYITNLGRPIDDNGEETDWTIGPGRVIETEEGTPKDQGYFERITGVSSLGPFGEHHDRIRSAVYEAAGLSDTARGRVDVQVTQSGVALALDLAPTISRAEEKNLEIGAVHAQMAFDLQQWYIAYEKIDFGPVRIDPAFGDMLPIDRAGRLSELNDMLDRSVISTAFYRQEAAKLGYVFPDDIDAQVQADTDRATGATDPYGARLDAESSGGTQ